MNSESEMVRILALGERVDDAQNPGAFWREFAADGVDVQIANDLDTCMDYLGRDRFHAVVLDLTASGRSLPELAQLKRRHADLPIFVLVDATDGSVGQWVTHHGAAACLDVKCFDAAATRTIIKNTVTHLPPND